MGALQSKVSRQKHKDKKITIYKEIRKGDSIGWQGCYYIPIHPGTIWAYKRQLSAGEGFAAMSMTIEEEMLFVVNWRRELKTNQVYKFFISCNGDWYDVKRIDIFEGYKEDIQIYASYENHGPGPEKILTYGEEIGKREAEDYDE